MLLAPEPDRGALGLHLCTSCTTNTYAYTYTPTNTHTQHTYRIAQSPACFACFLGLSNTRCLPRPLQASYDPATIAALLQQAPYHVDSLLAMHDLYRHMGEIRHCIGGLRG